MNCAGPLTDAPADLVRLRRGLADLASNHGTLPPAARLDKLIHAGLDRLPFPGRGQTLIRWRALAEVAMHDLSLAKLYEGHTDAQAILSELKVAAPAQDMSADHHAKPLSWGVWAAEPSDGHVTFIPTPETTGPVTLRGTKAWCSGAASASHALLTAWAADQRWLVALDLSQPQVKVCETGWHAVGMHGSASLRVDCDGAQAWPVGAAGDYLSRPGFWQGGAGVAACWYGGTLRIARALREALAGTSAGNTALLETAGRIDVALTGVAQQLRLAADWIDAHPQSDARELALRVRLATADCAMTVLREVGDVLGPAPFCHDAGFAQAAADLPVFVRQSHSWRDQAALGACVAQRESNSWTL